MALHRGIDGSDPIRTDPVGRVTGVEEERRLARRSRLAAGTLACPRCDAPVALTEGSLRPAHPLACPFCGHTGTVRDFLTLGEPSRATHVEVHVVRPVR